MSIRPLWLWRLLLLGFALAYLASTSLQAWVPPLLPFLAAAAVEAQFFAAGVRTGQRGRTIVDRGPQARDLEELGWSTHTVTVTADDAEVVLRPGEMSREEISRWLELHGAELAALGPG